MGTLPAELQQAVIGNRRAQAMLQVKRGRRVIILGAKSSNLPEGLRDNPLVDIWFGDNGLRQSIPDTAGLVLSTRFVSHDDFDRLKAEAHRKGVEFWPHPFTPDELRQILAPLVPVKPPSRLVNHGVVVAERKQEPARPAIAATALTQESGVTQAREKTGRGAIKSFVAIHGNIRAASVAIEARRLLALAQKTPEVTHTTAHSIEQAIYTARRNMKIPNTRGGRVVMRKTPATPAADLSRPRADVGPTDDLIQMGRDAVAAIQLLMDGYAKKSKALADAEAVKERLNAAMKAAIAGL